MRGVTTKVVMLGAAETGKTFLMRHWIYDQQPDVKAYIPTRGIIYHQQLTYPIQGDNGAIDLEITITPEEIGAALHQAYLERHPPIAAAGFILFFNSQKRSTYVAMWTQWWRRAADWIIAAQESRKTRPFIVFCDTASHATPKKRLKSRQRIESEILQVMPKHSYLFFSVDVASATKEEVEEFWLKVAQQIAMQHRAEKRDAMSRDEK